MYIELEVVINDIIEFIKILKKPPMSKLDKKIVEVFELWKERLLNTPADVAEVKHGYWKQTKEPLGVHDVDCIECSVCGESWIIDEDLSFEEHTEFCHYCTNCGAKMDGERKKSEVQGE